MKEVWKDIEGYEGLYQISNFGKVFSFKSNKILKPFNDKKGYLKIELRKENRRKIYFLHRLVAMCFIENKNNLPYVNHKDENKHNNRVENLEWCTCKYNNNYGTRNSRISKKMLGENNPMYGKRGDLSPNKHKMLGENNPMYGKHHSKETKRKMSESRIGLFTGNKNPRAKKVMCITTGEIFDYIGMAETKYNISHSNISACCKGKIKSAGKHPATREPMVWRYIEE